MKPSLRAIRGFWTAEEVPRWFGFSLVLLYLVGLGAVGFVGVSQIRQEAAEQFEWSSVYATQAFATRLAYTDAGSATDGSSVRVWQRMLVDFSARLPAKSARIADSVGRIIASTNPEEVGSVAKPAGASGAGPTYLEVLSLSDGNGGPQERVVRAPIHVRNGRSDPRVPPTAVENVDGPDAGVNPEPARVAASGLYVEVRLRPEFGTKSTLANHAGALTVILVVFGVLYVLYRCLRAQLRGMSRVAGRLRVHRDRIEQDLSSLRIADEADGVTAAWNELVDLATTLLDRANRNDANEELTRVLQQSTAGALADALNALPDGLMYITDEVRFEYVNTTVCRLFGWKPQEVKQFTLADARAQGVGGRVLNALREAQRPDGSFSARTEIVEDDLGDRGGAGVYRLWVVPIERTRREGECLAVLRDVSQQMRADRAREEFITQVTHELRTPLTNIRAYTETLSSGMFEDPNVVTECYNVITKETRRLSRLIEDVLSVSQLEVGSIELQIDDVDLRTLLTDGVRDVRGLADERNIDIQLQLPSKLESVRVDRDKLAVVINNLLGNAIKYTPPEGNVLVGCQISLDEVVLTFKDNGIGIEPADHARVFEKFQRSDDPQVQSETGTGIGLYTAREIVRRHGGSIELISAKNEGATFIVRLPHRASRATALSAVTETQHRGKNPDS